MAKDRSRDDRRSVGSHERMTSALGKATGSHTYEVDNNRAVTNFPKVANSAANATIFVPGQGHVSVGKTKLGLRQDPEFVKDKSSNEFEGTAGLSRNNNKTGDTKRQRNVTFPEDN